MKKVLRLVVLMAAMAPGLELARAQSAARDAGYRYLSPVPGASHVSAQTRYVLVRFENVTPAEVTNLATSFITVTGTNSGLHSGVTHVASDGRTVIFTMSVDFIQNELVTVTLNPQVDLGTSGIVEPYEYQFRVMAPMPGSLPTAIVTSPVAMGSPPDQGGVTNGPGESPEPTGGESLAAAVIKPNGVSVPSDFPAVVITVNSNPSPGYLFLETGVSGVPQYTMMLDNNGSPVWYRRGRMVNFKTEKNELFTWILQDASSFQACDQNFNFVRTFSTTNGFLTDGHELEVLADGTLLILGFRNQTVDLSKYYPGGSTSASVREGVIQEFTAAGELIFQWRAWDHYRIQDQAGNNDFPHMNALDVDEDGHLLVCCRHTSEVTKINRETGEIIWRLGGVNSGFSFSNDPLNGISYQHDINALGNGRYMVFDNGDTRPLATRVSRAVEYELDLTNMTATLVWQFRDTPDKYAYWQGNAQRLPSGNTLINFVRPLYPKAIEVDTNGVKRFELSLVPSSDVYRSFRFPWNGVVAAPYLIVEPQQDNITLIFNKFGDTNVAYYRIYGGLASQPTTLLATSPATLKQLTNLQKGQRYYFRVTAVNGQGVESDYSNEENLIVNVIKPGEPMVLNGDFALGTNSWNWAVGGGASGQWQISSGLSYFDITSGGSTVASLQVYQEGKPLFQGKKYVFEFDAWSQAPRYIEAKVGQAVSPYVNYSGIGLSFLTPTPTHFRYVFTMQQASDFNSSVMFNLGTSVFDVFLDNVSLFNAPPGDLNLDRCVNSEDLAILTGEWLKQQSGLAADLNGDGKVDFNDFALFGENWTGTSPCP